MKLTPEQVQELKRKMGLSDAQVAELKVRLSAFAAQADEAVDNWLIKIAKSKWSWAIVLAILAAGWLLQGLWAF